MNKTGEDDETNLEVDFKDEMMRAFRLIFGSFDYLDFCSRNGLSTLYERRDLLARQFFKVY